MEPAKTVSIVCPENVRAGYKNIPAADFDPAVHVLFDAATGKPVQAASNAGGAAIDIPADYLSLHWKQRGALAEKLNGDAAVTPAEGQTQAEAADAVIAAEVAKRGEK